MNSLVEYLQKHPDLLAGIGVSADAVRDAETKLSTSFSNEYRDYLLSFGIAALNGHELTGLGSSKRVNVVDVTLANRERYKGTNQLYVVEEANIDGIVIWQSSAGEIYQTLLGEDPIKYAESLFEYVKA